MNLPIRRSTLLFAVAAALAMAALISTATRVATESRGAGAGAVAAPGAPMAAGGPFAPEAPLAPDGQTALAADIAPWYKNMELVGHIGGWTDAVFMDDRYAYFGVGPKLAILDIADIGNLRHPKVIGWGPLLNAPIRDIAVQDM